MDMKKLVDLLLKRDDLKEIPMSHKFKVVSSVFDIIKDGNVFYKE